MENLSRFILAIMVSLLLRPAYAENDLRNALRNSPLVTAGTTKVLAVYEPWFGHPRHIDVGYSSQDPVVIRKQIQEAKKLGISGFVVDWYGDREPFIDKSYALVQALAADRDFKVAMMFDEADRPSDQATDDALAAFEKFRQQYLAPTAPGRKAYLEYRGRPVIFIFPKGGHTDWNRVRAETNRWNPAPLLIQEFPPGPLEKAFDGFYAWINPGKSGWTADGNNWGEDYLRNFYQTMQSKYPDRITVGTAWAGFDDKKASWSLGRYMSARCGATFADTVKLAQDYNVNNAPPFLLIATWNDYEEGTAIERGTEKCKSSETQGH